MENIDIKIIRRAEPDAVVRLYHEAGWWRSDYTDDFIPEVLARSFAFAGAFDGNCLIGMGRAIADGVSDAYIQDVAVLTAYRGHGIGGRIIRALIDHLHRTGIDWIGLIGEPGTQKFYERLGFEPMPGCLPMILKTPPDRSNHGD